LKKVKDEDDHEAITRAADELSVSAQKVGAKMYNEQKSEVGDRMSDSGNQTKENSGQKPDEPVDAEFKEKE
jgi:hypothetical protein